jgi:hypothetical protein
VTLIGREDGKAAHDGRGGDCDVLEAGIMRSRPVEDRSSLAGLLDPNRQDARSVEMLQCCKPTAKPLRLRGSADSVDAGDAGFDLCDHHGRDIEALGMFAHPSRERLRSGSALGRRIR